MRVIAAITAAILVAVGIHALRAWMVAQIVAWEATNKALTDSEILFVRVAGWITNYWYVLVGLVLLATLLAGAPSPRRSTRDPDHIT